MMSDKLQAIIREYAELLTEMPDDELSRQWAIVYKPFVEWLAYGTPIDEIDHAQGCIELDLIETETVRRGLPQNSERVIQSFALWDKHTLSQDDVNTLVMSYFGNALKPSGTH